MYKFLLKYLLLLSKFDIYFAQNILLFFYYYIIVFIIEHYRSIYYLINIMGKYLYE
jgi:hypothetical protein